jgi:hypothetical protein
MPVIEPCCRLSACAAGGCLTRTIDSSGRDDIGVTRTVAFGPGIGFGWGASIYYEISTCTTLACLNGWFGYRGASAQIGVGVSATVFWGDDNRYAVPTAFGLDLGVSFGDGAEASLGFSYTWVNKFSSPYVANPMRWLWDDLTAPVRWITDNMSGMLNRAGSFARRIA